MSKVERKLIVVGFGPAGLGAILHAYQTGKYTNIEVIDPTQTPGSGGLEGVDIHSNSPGNDFTQPYEEALLHSRDEEERNVYREILESPEAAALQGKTSPVPLSQAADFLKHVARTFINKGVVLHVQARATGITFTGDEYRVTTSPQSSNGPTRTIEADDIVFALGAKEKLLPKVKERDPEITYTSRELLANTPRYHALYDQLLQASQRAETPEVWIVGGQHSAYSLAERFLPTGVHIHFCKRSHTKPFFGSVEVSLDHGYEPSEDEICPETEKVNRWDGVRGRALDVWHAQQRGEVNLQDHYDISLEDIPSHAIVIQATGHTALDIPLVDDQGAAVKYETRVTSEGCVSFWVNGEQLPGAFAVGLGQPGPDGTNVYPQQAGRALALMR